MPQGIVRNKYQDFMKTKGKKSITKQRFSKASLNKIYEDEDLMKSTLLSYTTKASQVQMSQIQQPSWIDDYKDCNFILKEVDILRQQIKKQNAKKLMSTRQEVHERKICLLAQQATQKLRKCEKKLKNIELSNNMNPNPNQRKLFTNIIVSLAQKIRSSTKKMRNDRQSQLSHQRQIQQYNRSSFDEQIKHLSQNTEQDWLSEQGFDQLQQNLMQQRNQQIMKIVKSIHSLNTIYKQLQDLVIHQGSLLDRIDQNLQTTYERVQQANQHLKKAQQHQQNSFAKKIIYVLVFLIFIFFAIFMLKHK